MPVASWQSIVNGSHQKKYMAMKTKCSLFAIFLFATIFTMGQWTTTYFSQAVIRTGGVKLGNKAWFAGGSSANAGNWFDTDNIEIYDMATGTWEIDHLTQARAYAVGVTCGDKAFFAGGLMGYPFSSSRVDIITTAGIWDYYDLSIPRFSLAAVANDTLALFAGGADISLNQVYDVVDMYHANTNTWTLSNLSLPRCAMGFAAAGGRAFFAGGMNVDNSMVYNRVDIYNFSDGTWDTASLSQARGHIGTTVVGQKVIFAGGSLANSVVSDRVDIFDLGTGQWSTTTMPAPKAFSIHQSVTFGDKAWFVAGSVFNNGWDTDSDTIDIFDPADNTWSVLIMPSRLNDHTVIVMDTSVLIGGGWTFTTYPWGNPQDEMYIYSDPSVGTGRNHPNSKDMVLYPNPARGTITIETRRVPAGTSLIISGIQGRPHMVVPITQGRATADIRELPAGIYIVQLTTANSSLVAKFVKE